MVPRTKGSGAWLDWFAVFVATSSFVFIVLWAASPDSSQLTVELALYRTASYSVPITLGMWGIARATRRGSTIPESMSKALPYARLGKDGKLEAVTQADETPTPLQEGTSDEVDR